MSDASTSAFATDLLGRNRFASRFERFLLTEHHFVEGALVLTLNGPFGAGKSTFVRMWADDLRARRGADTSLPRPVILNAWETDYCGDPLVAIIAALKDALIDPQAPDPQPEMAKSLKEAVKDLSWFALALANSFVSKGTGVDPIKAGDLATEKKAERAAAAEFYPKDLLEAYTQRLEAVGKIKTALSNAFKGEDARAIVVIDELDRCRPDYAVSYLETIKHVFDVHGIVFVLCVDKQQLASVASVLFGTQLNFDEYYRKFSHRTVHLPEPTEEEVERLTNAYVTRYLEREGKRWTAFGLGSGSIVELFAVFKVRPRQAQEAFRIIGHAFSKPSKNDQQANWYWATIVVLMAVLKVARPLAYAKMANPDARPRDVANVVRDELSKSKNPKHWFEMLVSMLRRDERWEAETEEQMKEFKIIPLDGEKVNVRHILRDFLRWNHYDDSSSLAGTIANRLESIAGFAER